MCLTVEWHNAHIEKVEEEITAFKILMLRDGKLLAPFQLMQYRPHTVYPHVELGFKNELINKRDYAVVERGYHTYENEEWARYKMNNLREQLSYWGVASRFRVVLMKMFIPRGSGIVIGTLNQDLVSSVIQTKAFRPL